VEIDADNVDGIDSEPFPFQSDIFDPRYWFFLLHRNYAP
jgi:hypothetical protein